MSIAELSKQHGFEILGFFEELIDSDTAKLLGTRRVELDQARPFGSKGSRSYILDQPIQVLRGHRHVMVKASARRPIRCFGMVQPLCGRALSKAERE